MKKIIYPTLISILVVSVCFIFLEELEVYFLEALTLAENEKGTYALLSFGVLSSDIVLPVPSSIVMYSNGMVLGVLKGALLSLLAMILSSSIGYAIGYFSAIGMKSKEDEQTNAILEKYGSMGIILTRGIPILSESICFTAGYNKMGFRLFFLFNIMGCIPICIIYAFFGSMGKDGGMFLISFGISIFISFLLFYSGKRFFINKADV